MSELHRFRIDPQQCGGLPCVRGLRVRVADILDLHAAGAESQEGATAEQKADAARWEAEIAKRRYVIIVDEAHSSQSGETARELKAILGTAKPKVEFSAG